MSCGNIPGTGGPAAWLLLAGLACLIVGLLLYRRSGHRADLVALIVILMLGTVGAVAAPSPVHAASNDCVAPPVEATNALTITQTSVIDGLGPTSPPAEIRGLVTNLSLDSTFVSTVTVSIASVSKAAGAAPGTCSAADFVLTEPRMTVELPLPARSHVSFSGATIAFLSSSSNQDACKRATIHFKYVSDSR